MLEGALFILLCFSAAAAANVTIVDSGAAEETAPAWFLADRIVRARERAEDRTTMSTMQQTLSAVQQTQSAVQQTQSAMQQTLSAVQQTQSAMQQTQSAVQQNLSTVQQNLSTVQQNLSTVQQTLSEVADAVVTGVVAECVDLCAPSTALLILVEMAQDAFAHGSAVPNVQRSAAAQTAATFLQARTSFVAPLAMW